LARTYLNQYCDARYRKSVVFDGEKFINKPLTGFDGKRIKINKKGALTPVDAVLEYVDGENILTLSANICFFDNEYVLSDKDMFYAAVYEGFKAWEGEYEVFGGQKLRVVVELTEEDRAFDNVYVIPLDRGTREKVTEIWERFGSEKIKTRVRGTFSAGRSFAGIGIGKWSASSRKIIVIQSTDGDFGNFEEILHTAKHEFGHVLGLGDLYRNEVDGYSGVDKGTYSELDGYYITDNIYNLVMCDSHGPISNNDIEMVVLAFSENRMQNYQKRKVREKISAALGKGN